MPDNNSTSIRRAAIYARVSTEHEAQLYALENQKEWYNTILAQHPEWKVVEMYVDEGITGTSALKRAEFMRMVADAQKGEFDLILTREVSRFARNTVDTLQYTRELKKLGVEVFFINDNIRTFDGDGELRLTIMATLAQDESRKTSIRVKAGQQTSMDKGVFYGNGNILGYDRVGKDLVINQEQARTVRKIYDWYLDGWGMKKIKYQLETEGIPTAMGKTHWYETNISKILQNPFYAGIIEYHKQYVPDFLEQKKINNFGDIERTRVVGRHEPIITLEEFNRVQEIIKARRMENPNNKTGKRSIGYRPAIDVWSRLLDCYCGHKFNRKVWHRTDTEVQYAYQCNHQARMGTVRTRQNKGLSLEGACRSPMLPRWKLQLMAKNLFREFLTDTDRVLELAAQMLEKHIFDKEETADNAEIIEKKNAEINKLENRINNLIEMRADGEIDKDTFNNKRNDAEAQIFTLKRQIKELSPYESDEEYDEPDYEEKITILKYALHKYLDFEGEEDIPENVVEAFVEKIMVYEDCLDWYLRFDNGEPKHCKVTGKRRNDAKYELLSPTQVERTTGCNS